MLCLVKYWLVCCRREAVQVRVRGLRPEVRQQFGPQEALSRPHVGQTVQLPRVRLRQELHASQLTPQAYEGNQSPT